MFSNAGICSREVLWFLVTVLSRLLYGRLYFLIFEVCCLFTYFGLPSDVGGHLPMKSLARLWVKIISWFVLFVFFNFWKNKIWGIWEVNRQMDSAIEHLWAEQNLNVLFFPPWGMELILTISPNFELIIGRTYGFSHLRIL